MHKSETETIEKLATDIARDEAALREKKRQANALCAKASLPLRYGDDELLPAPRDLLAGKGCFEDRPLAVCIKQILIQRGAHGLPPASSEQIFRRLLAGAFDFTSVSTKSLAQQRRGLTITLSRNPSMFTQLPNGTWTFTDKT